MSNALPKVRQFDGHDWFSTKTYRRNLPHWELKGSTYFITIRVDAETNKPFLNPESAYLIISKLYEGDKINYDLQAFVIMPDHVHLLIKPFEGNTLAMIMQKIKGSSAHGLNKILNRKGRFWQSENFDRIVRDGIDLRQKWEYIKENPVKARLVDIAENYPYSSFFFDKSSILNTRGINPSKTNSG